MKWIATTLRALFFSKSLTHFHLRNLYVLSTALILLVNLGCIHDLSADIKKNKGTGLRAVSTEKVEHVEKNWPTIIGVRANKVGLERVDHERNSKELAPLMLSPSPHHDEFIVVTGNQENMMATEKRFK